jgi:hypothetical protein
MSGHGYPEAGVATYTLTVSVESSVLQKLAECEYNRVTRRKLVDFSGELSEYIFWVGGLATKIQAPFKD